MTPAPYVPVTALDHGAAPPMADPTAVDQVVDRLRTALSRHGLYFPSLRSDTIPTNGSYLVILGSASVATASALVEVLDGLPVR